MSRGIPQRHYASHRRRLATAPDRDYPTPAREIAADRKRTAAFLKTLSSSTHERTRLFWSGDRIEWLLSRGFNGWLSAEIDAGRATFPE
jgi:hypothetical protein